MATKKTATSAKKAPAKKSAAAATKTTTKVTTVTASAAKTPSSTKKGFNFSRSPLLAASIAEFIGTFMLAAIVLATNGSSVAVFFGVIAIVIAIGAVSDAHINPAITIGAWATRRIDGIRAVSYLIAQILGAMAALVILSGFVSAAPETTQSSQMAMFGQASAPELFKLGEIAKDKQWLFLAAELIGAALFAFGVASVLGREKNRAATALGVSGALFIGLTVTAYLTGVVSGSTSGAGPAVLNPAVATALQGFSDFSSAWPIMVWAVAPAIGGVLGFGLRDLIREESEEK